MINKVGSMIGQSLNKYNQKLKPSIDDLKFKEQYRSRIIDCMVGEVDDNYIQTPPTDSSIVKLENSRKGLVKLNSIKGKTVLVDAEGNVTDTPAEGCRLVSAGEEESNKLIILSKNKNLNDNPNISVTDNGNGYFNATQGIFGKVEKGRMYTISCDINTTTTSSNLKVRGMNANNTTTIETYTNWGSFSDGKYKMTFTPTVDAYIGFTGSNYNNTTLTNIQLEEGNVVTDYVPHKSNKTEILLDEPLNNIQETYDFIENNKIYRNTKKMLLKKDNNGWSINVPWTNDEFLAVSKNFKDRKPKSYVQSNLFPAMTYAQSLVNGKISKECVRYESSSQAIYIFIKKERLEKKNLDGFIAWLENSDMEIIYELEEPIIEELPNGFTLQGFDDTTMYIENKVTPTVVYEYDAIIPLKENVVRQREEVENNTLDVNNNILPYLMDMEFNLIMMEE